MDVADSSEVTEDAIIISVSPEIVSTAVSSSQCSNSLANDLDRAETSKGNVVEQLQRHITLLELTGIKSPLSKAGMTIEEACQNKTFFLEKLADGTVRLKRNLSLSTCGSIFL